jgi:inhibitor of cysteine peptidase
MEGEKGRLRFTRGKKTVMAVALGITVLLSIGVVSRNSKLPVNGKNELPELPVVGSYSNLEKLMKKAFPNQEFWMTGMDMMKSDASVARAGGGSAGDFSKTNVQVQGVDEADVVKTDGEYVYKIYYNYSNNVSEQGIQIIKAYPGENLQLVQKVVIQDMHPSQMFLKDNYLIVLGSGMKKSQGNEAPSVRGGAVMDRIWLPVNSTVVAMIYDIKDKQNPKLLRTVEVDGNLATARMIGNNIYMVSNKYLYMHWLKEGDKRDEILPSYRDSAVGKDYKTIDLKEVRYCPQALEPNYIIISSFNIGRMNEEVNVTTVLGSSSNIFSSLDNLYVSGYNYKQEGSYNTSIYKFNLKDGRVNFASTGEVPGNILNQFSMDEYKGYFRVTTTSHPQNGNWMDDSVNNIYVLNKDMKLVGKVEGLAKGERIYSTRFMGDKAYMVTFRNTDPLYVIDLKNPQVPKVLGELKIPGFSNYLHPYDENHIIGFGLDAEVINSNGRETALQQGMKLAIFDVSDVKNPKQKFMEIIGDRGTHSELLYNHKALLFSKEKNLLAFPVTVAEIKKQNDPNNSASEKVSPDWGYPTFIGAYVYNIDLKKGFDLRGKITHINQAEFDSRKYDYNGQISRVLYIKDNLYTVSESLIKVNKLGDLKETGKLQLSGK